ncbi:APC family permease [Phytohabitans suffuscus]
MERDEDTGTVETTSSTTGAKRKLPRLPLLGGVVFLALAMWAASSTFGGALAAVYVYAFLNFFAGVVALVALSLTVMCGLVATDRFFLKIGHRVFFQGLHRATAIIAVVFLGLHIAMKVLSGSATVIDPFVPFANPLNPVYIGLGTIASYLMFTVFWTGLIRARFAGSGKPWMWRTLHASSYLAWPAALGHGLNAGRPAATWVWLGYGACVVGVVIALLVRVYVSLGRRTTGKTGPSAVGVNVETAIIPRVTDAGLREGLMTSTREQRAIRDEALENTATRMMTTSRPPREREDTRVGYAMPVAPPEQRRPREEERMPDELVSPGERRASRPERSERSDARRSRLEQMDERAEERRVLERAPARREERADVGERMDDMRQRERRSSRSGSRTEDKRSATQWRRRSKGGKKDEGEATEREWYESLRGDEPVSGYGPGSGAYAPTSPAPAPQPERERYGRGEQSGGRRRADSEGERWTSPADERYADIDPVSAPVGRYDQSREPVSGPAPRYDQSREPVSGPAPRYDQSRYDEPRYEQERPRRAALRLVTDEEKPRRSGRSRSSRGEDPRQGRREDGRHSLGETDEGPVEYASEPGYERPGPYPPAVEPAPSRRSRRGRRAAGGEDMDNGAYWTRPREGYGR